MEAYLIHLSPALSWLGTAAFGAGLVAILLRSESRPEALFVSFLGVVAVVVGLLIPLAGEIFGVAETDCYRDLAYEVNRILGK